MKTLITALISVILFIIFSLWAFLGCKESAVEPEIDHYKGRIAFLPDRTGSRQIYTMNTDGSNVINLTKNEAENFSPAFSPDGSKIAFEYVDMEIYIMNTDGSNRTRLTNNESLDINPVFQPL